MPEITYRWMRDDEVVKVRDIDRAERVRVGYEMRPGKLVARDVDWDIPNFRTEGDGSHTVEAQVRFCRGHLLAGGRLIGAFDGERLVGIGAVTPEIRPATAQLAYLHVSTSYRRRRIASRLSQEMIRYAMESGASRMYVSATPSESAVGFYRSLGFTPTEPLPELYELEPEDIHMMKDLGPSPV